MTTVQRLDGISEEDVAAWHRVVVASVARDLPGEPAPTLEQVREQLAGGQDVRWVATAEGAAVGVARLRLSEGVDHLGQFTLHVHPDHRRRGVGTRLLRAVAEAAREADRRSLVVEASSAATSTFLEARGFECVLSLSLLLLNVYDVEPAELDEMAAARPGYRLTRWLGVAPQELAETFAAAKGSMGDMPAKESGATEWDVDRVREMAEAVEKRGDTLLTVAAVHDGTVAGFTELVVPAGDGSRAIQYDTAVVPEHRGNGLGLWVKAAMLLWLRADWPDVAEIETDNADDNAHMLAVNERLGFRPLRRTRQYEARPETILGAGGLQ